MKEIIYVFFIVRIFISSGYYIVKMNDETQIETSQLQINLPNYGIDSYFAYGLWSRYTPLSKIALVGSLGILDSNCFHLHNAVDQTTKELNFIVYDCLDYEANKIIRRVQFVTMDGVWHFFEVLLDNEKYEYIWHYFEITVWPQRKRFELLIIQYPVTKLDQIEEDIVFPYKSNNILLTFGGGLQIKQQNIVEILKGIQKFSFFPGYLYLYPLSSGTMLISRNAANIAIGVFQYIGSCSCSYNQYQSSPNIELTNLETLIFPSQYKNCNSFQFATWIKIRDIYKSSDEFLYQIIKLAANYENPQFVNQNLAAFQLFYNFGSQQNKLIYTTYSFTFPLVSINFQDNPFLIRKEFDLQNNIKLWHFVNVVFKSKQLTATTIFYEGLQQFEYKFQMTVKQFSAVQFKLSYGNLLQLSNDYISVQLKNPQFFNCVSIILISQLNCDISCEKCDGPTNRDCLSCSQDSKRIYNAEQKSCVCPYNTLDNLQCNDFSSYNLILVNEDIKKQKCLQGYFQLEENCIKCPSIKTDKSISCLECVNQPDTWSSNSFCQTTLSNDDQGMVSQYISTDQLNYIYDGNDLQIRYYASLSNDDEQINNEFVLSTSQFKGLCFKTSINLRSEKECYDCNIANCMYCQLVQLKLKCLSCSQFSTLIDGVCYQNYVGISNTNNCVSPYYYTSMYQCRLCDIENCLYCFEYLSNDLTKCTLYKNFQQFNIDDSHKVGCALCKDGLIFDFTINKCKQQIPQINNCLRSYINQSGQEICTLSKVDDFSIAPSIINCQKYIAFCQQCILSPQNLIKCILCENGYTVSLSTGQCYQCTIDKAVICIEGDYFLNDGWVQSIQSFLMQFLPDQYYYPNPYPQRNTIQQIMQCIDGYRPAPNNQCIKYCDSNCLLCLITDQYPYEFHCKQCPLNYYDLAIKSSEDGKCLQCPQLCMVCQSRTEQEIKMINPYFVVNDQTIHYTFKCIQRAPDNNIVIDPYTKIAKYCENSLCTDNIQYQVDIDCDNHSFLLNPNFQQFYQNNIDPNYCNNFGVQKIIILMRINIQNTQQCNLPFISINFQNNLKEKIYTLQEVQLKMVGLNKYGLFSPVKVFNFSTVEISNMVFEIQHMSYLNLENSQSQINLIINNSTIFGRLGQIQQYSINIQKSGDLIIDRLDLLTLNLLNSSLLDYVSVSSQSQITIKDLFVYNSNFTNSVLLQFYNLQQTIYIINIRFQNCYFQNSTIFLFNQNSMSKQQIYIENLKLFENTLINSSLILLTNQIQINLQNINILSNQIKDSILLDLNYNLVIQIMWLYDNTFILSLFARITEVQGQSNNILINDLIIQSNEFQTSSILETQAYTNSYTSLELTNIQIKDNKKFIEQKGYLFSLNCYQILIRDCKIKDSSNIHHFNLLEMHQITIENIIYQNKLQINKVPLSFECLNSQEQNSQLFQIYGFYKLTINDAKISNQFSINFSLIHILSNTLYSPNIREIIEIKNVQFQGNILLKQNLGSIISLISIYSEKFQEITLENILFQEDFFNEQNDDPTQTSAGLIFINSQQSSVSIINITCQQNAITNSSNSFIYINSNSILTKNIQIKNHNLLNQTIWNKYYDVPSIDQKNIEDINQIIQSIFTIQNKGGVMSITSSNILIAYGQFQQISSGSSSLFDIKTQGQGIVLLDSLNISQTEVDLVSTTETQGCISIYSRNSMLNLQIKNVKFQSVFNRLSSSILSITPSQKYNKIEILDVSLQNCLTLINQFMKIEFSLQKLEQNLVVIQNLFMYQSDQDWIEYFYRIDPISQSEMNKVNDDNALINLNGCELFIKNLQFDGTYISPILKITDSPKIQIFDCKIRSITTFYSFNIMQFIQTKFQKSIIQLETILLRNITVLQNINELPISQKAFQNKFYLNKCTIQKIDSVDQVQYSNSFQQILKYLNSNTSSAGSLMLFQSISIENFINLKTFSVIQNNFSGNLRGLINFELQGFKVLKISDFNFLHNGITQLGCINFIANQNLENRIKLINSKFILNNGTFGSAIFAQKVILDIQNCQFLQNYASQQGGAIYMENCNNNFNIINSLFLENQAQYGGGIYFNGNNQLNKNNFRNSLIKLNSAEKLTENVVEIPHHLSLQINSYIMHSSQEMEKNVTTNILKLNSYRSIEQGQLFNTSQLYLPSNQQITSFQLFNPKNQGFIQYIYEFSLFFQNSINEKVPNIINFTCNTQMFTQLESNQSIQDPKTIEVLPYNYETNKFNLEQYKFTFDPYQNIDSNLFVQINCTTQYDLQTIRYIIKAKTFKCQLGEFYVNNGCQQCQSSQGFYSVTYNATKCSIFDKSKFTNITSNKIQLLQGYWRPDILSDYSEICFKQQQYCLGGWDVGNKLCFQGHIGGLCEECDNYNIRGEGNYYKNLQNYSCESCSLISNSIISFTIASLWSILQIILTLKSIDRSNQLFQSLKLRMKYSKILFKLNQDHQGILIKMLVNFLWIFSVIFSFNIQFTFSFGIVDQVSNPSNFMATSLDCYLLGLEQIQLSYSRIIAMLILILIQMITIFVGFRILYLVTKSKFQNSVISNTGLYLYVSNFAALVKQFSSLLSRRQISNIDYVQGNVSLLFDTQSHYKWIYSFILPGLGFVGCFIPMFLFSLMFIMRKKLDQIKLRRHICYMFNEYDEHCYFWEYIKIWKKTILIIILTYFETNILLKASLLGLSLLVYQVCTVNAKPYVNKKLNSLDLETGQICSISIFLAATKYVCEQQENQIYSYLLQFVIILLCIKLCYPFIYEIFRVYYKKYKNGFINLLLEIIKLVNRNSRLVQIFKKKVDNSKKKEEKLKLHFLKLKQYLFSVSKLQSENQKLHISLQQPKSTFRILTSRENENMKFIKTDQD